MAPTRHGLIENFRRLANDFRGNPASFNSLAEQAGLSLARVAEFPDILPDGFRALIPPAKYPPMTPPEQIGFARRTAWVMALTLAGKAGVLANPLRMKTISRDVGIVVSGATATNAELAIASARLCEYLADELAKQASPQTGPAATHSDDYRSVNWRGDLYDFSVNQAACVRILWEHWERGRLAVSDANVLESADISGERLDAVFRGHPAWGAMIVPGQSKGTHRLASQK